MPKIMYNFSILDVVHIFISVSSFHTLPYGSYVSGRGNDHVFE